MNSSWRAAQRRFLGLALLALILLSACAPALPVAPTAEAPAATPILPAVETPFPATPSPATPAGGQAAATLAGVTSTPIPASATPESLSSPTLDSRFSTLDSRTPTLDSRVSWQDLPILPVLSERARQVLLNAVQSGAKARAFAKAGDCETLTDWFLTDFDRGPRFYNLGPYQDLQPVIDYYQGSFGRTSLAARRGFNAAALLTPFWADQTVCKPDETPLGCELRITNPLFVLIMVGTNDVPRKDSFEPTLRKVIDFSLAHGVLPVLATKADNLEGDDSINAAIGRLAQEYELPLWNFWRAVQDLPSRGLVEDGAHLTFLPNDFSNPANLQAAWPVRNLNALQLLNILMNVTEK